VLAYHYLQALELAQATGDTEQADELARPARSFLVLAGERALGLNTAQAEAHLARALELTPSEDRERAELLVHWAEAAFQGGRVREAGAALDQALPALRDRGEAEPAARALQLRSRVSLRLGDGQHVALAAEAVELLEGMETGRALVAAYVQLANAQCVAGAYAEAIAATNRALELAHQLGEPEPARALGYHGFGRALLGDAGGVGEMEQALALLVERGAGRDAAILQNNLAIARYPLEGPARSLADFEEAIVVAEQRGLGESVALLDCSCPGLLVELGRPEEALERADRLVPGLEASGAMQPLVEVRAVALATRLARGGQAEPAEAEWLVEAARLVGSIDIVLSAFASACALHATRVPKLASALLAELEQTEGARESPYYARQLPAMIRTALRAGDPAVAERLAEGTEVRYPLEEHALHAARAQVAEHAGDRAAGVSLYDEVAARWENFGNVPERAFALLGKGRCLRALGQAGAEEPLREAHELFGSMGYKPALAETEALLEQPSAVSAS
jgi:tetratricopeptide (TPR) repeat protein